MSKVEGLDFTEEQMKNASAEIVNGWRDYVGVVEDLFKQGKYGELQTEAYDVYRKCLSAIKLAEEGAKERSNASYLNDKGENVIEKRLQRLEMKFLLTSRLMWIGTEMNYCYRTF